MTMIYFDKAHMIVLRNVGVFGGVQYNTVAFLSSCGGVAQMVERSLCMREVPGSIPGVSITYNFVLHM